MITQTQGGPFLVATPWSHHAGKQRLRPHQPPRRGPSPRPSPARAEPDADGRGHASDRAAGDHTKQREGHPAGPAEGRRDLPARKPPSSDPRQDRAALTGDPRNDENLIVAQLHVAFLKAHNVLVSQGLTFEQAQTVLRQHYQHIVVHDFLKRIADPAIVDAILTTGLPRLSTPIRRTSSCRWSSASPPTGSATR